MQIVIPPPRITQGEVGRALERELRSGLQLKKATEAERFRRSAQEAQEFKGHKSLPQLGKMVANIPEWEFFRMIQKYGHAEVHSREFLRYFQKKHGDLSPNSV